MIGRLSRFTANSSVPSRSRPATARKVFLLSFFLLFFLLLPFPFSSFCQCSQVGTGIFDCNGKTRVNPFLWVVGRRTLWSRIPRTPPRRLSRRNHPYGGFII
ncbi:hypothetical protein CDEST_00709 [Colletotrichum destructivum]|uniref:Secreted protein n=1 Tax=Colletotrichum destructivum TaxID=34406 RepID=A0AAX4HXM0_9PEZI|nr:hypothetical protein CDEST_00709 [Colletotrichum destructivum]